MHHFSQIGVCLIISTIVSIHGFSIVPVGLSGTYNHLKTGKSRFGLTWSRNLDQEIRLRKELCPHIRDHIAYQYRYHNETRACYKVSDKGPCGDNMAFFAYQTNALYGVCDCNYNDHERALIMDPEKTKCHFVFTRGYCNTEEWLTFSPSTWTPICERNKCLKFYNNVNINAVIPEKNTKAVSVEFLPYKNSCVPLGLSCQNKDMDQDSAAKWASLDHLPHQIQFIKGKLYPRCAPTENVHWRHPTPKLQCIPGGFLANNNNNNSGNGKQMCSHHFHV